MEKEKKKEEKKGTEIETTVASCRSANNSGAKDARCTSGGVGWERVNSLFCANYLDQVVRLNPKLENANRQSQ